MNRRLVASATLTFAIGLTSAWVLHCNSILGLDPVSAEPCYGTHCPECTQYCRTVTNNCQGDFSEYQSPDVCLRMCDTLTTNGQWVPSDMIGPVKPVSNMGNTLDCRWTFAILAGGPDGAVANCEYAGLLGGDQCRNVPSDSCTNFCAVNFNYCTVDGGPDGAPLAFNSTAECNAACSFYPFDGSVDNVSDLVVHYNKGQGDNTLNCRAYHLGFAIQGDPGDLTTHCPHTLPSGGGACAPAFPPSDAGSE